LTNAPNIYKFTGKERDTESGLDNFGARFDASSFGRFISPDETLVDQQTADPQSWNLYAYARNNPTDYTDEDGRTCTKGKDGNFTGGWHTLKAVRRFWVAYPLRFCFLQRVGPLRSSRSSS